MNHSGQTNASNFQRFLNNKSVMALVITLLILIIIFMLNKVNFIFYPVRVILQTVGAPIIVAFIFYYLLNPMVNYLTRRFKITRTTVIVGQFIVLAALIFIGIVSVIPWLRDQSISLIQHWPSYWKSLTEWMNQTFSRSEFSSVNQWLQLNNDAIQKFMSSFLHGGTQNLSGFFSSMTKVMVTIITFPLILFYLLKDGDRVAPYVAKFLPNKMRQPFLKTEVVINAQMANYIRGQLSVAGVVMIMFAIGFLSVGLPYGWLLAILAGFLNLIPFLGSFLAMIPALIVAAFVSPMLLLKVLIVFSVEQILEGKVVSPKLLGESLKIHPVTVVVILLSSGAMFGFWGVLLGIPGYAALKVIVINVYQWWRSTSELFEEEVKVHESIAGEEPNNE